MDDGDLPDLRVMELRVDGNSVRKKSLTLECEDIGWRWSDRCGRNQRFFRHFDPDVILSDDGDASLLPLFFSAERKESLYPWDRNLIL